MGPIALEIAESSGIELKSYIENSVRVANGHLAPIVYAATFEFELGNNKKKLEALIMPNLSNQCILGADFF